MLWRLSVLRSSLWFVSPCVRSLHFFLGAAAKQQRSERRRKKRRHGGKAQGRRRGTGHEGGAETGGGACTHGRGASGQSSPPLETRRVTLGWLVTARRTHNNTGALAFAHTQRGLHGWLCLHLAPLSRFKRASALVLPPSACLFFFLLSHSNQPCPPPHRLCGSRMCRRHRLSQHRMQQAPLLLRRPQSRNTRLSQPLGLQAISRHRLNLPRARLRLPRPHKLLLQPPRSNLANNNLPPPPRPPLLPPRLAIPPLRPPPHLPSASPSVLCSASPIARITRHSSFHMVCSRLSPNT